MLIPDGFFVDSARAIAVGDHRQFNSVVVQHATNPEIMAETKIAQSLLTAFRSEVHSKFFSNAWKAVQRPLRLRRGEHEQPARRNETADPISKLIQDYESAAPKRRRHIGAFESKARVDKQIEAIREVIFAGRNSLAEKYLEDLVAFQLGQGDREYAGMSLCALTAISLDANQFEMADRLSRYALKLAPDDRVVYTNRAEVFKRRGQFDAALKAYEEALERFRRDRWSLNGYADVLKEKGLFEESITRYKQTQCEFPDDAVAFNGEVGVLKASGKRRAALGLAVRYAKRFEYDAVTRATLAGCLASVGKFDEAARQYLVAIGLDSSEVKIHVGYVYALRESGNLDGALRHADGCVRKFPDTPQVLQLKATLLRNSERFVEAEALYKRLIDNYPTYIPAQFGMAALRVLQKRAEEARQKLPEQGMESELDWFAFRLRALSYASDGDYHKAAPRLSFSLKQCPWLKERSKSETALGLVELRRGDHGKSIGLLNHNLDQLDMVDRQIRLTFLAHAHAERGAKDVASVFLGRLFSSKESTLKTLRNAISSEYDLNLPISEPRRGDVAQIGSRELALAMAA